MSSLKPNNALTEQPVSVSDPVADPVPERRSNAAVEPIQPWWRHAVVYEVYPRSFADGNGDGIGDLAGVRSRLEYLRELGVDALWFTPWYASPWADGGYDVADYRRINPEFGSVADAEVLIEEADALGIRTIVDIVPNHVSTQHRWFQEALAAGPGSESRSRFWFHPGRGSSGEQIPTNWPSSFSGEAWTRTANSDGTPGEWYLHLFDAAQPDLNWTHPDVQREFEDVLRFWFDRGVAGVRVDSAAFVIKDERLPELDAVPDHPFHDRDELHELYRGWRGIADEYDGERILVGEIWLADLDRFALYLRPDEMHSAFNFDFMTRPWDAGAFRDSIAETLAVHAQVNAPATWVLSNHDVIRPVTRYGRADSSFGFADSKRFGIESDLELGTRRARAAALITGALPGVLYIYQGDELGLPEVEDLPAELRRDPMFLRSGGVDPGREGCRVPLPWTRAEPNFGFSKNAVAPWLPQPSDWGERSVEAQASDESSMLALYREMLRLRRELPTLRDAGLTWLPIAADGVLAFDRDGIQCIANMTGRDLEMPLERADVLIASVPLAGDVLPADSAVWIRTTA